jgi:hypothetical protein
LHDKAFGKMTKEDLDTLAVGKIDDAVYAVADGVESHDPMVKQLGHALRDYIDPRNSMLIRSDAMKPAEMSEDRFFRNTYDQSKVNSMGKENWVVMQKSLIDIEKTFKNTRAIDLEGNIDHAIVDEMIGNTFDNIVQGNGALFTRPSVARDKEAIERTRHMFYKFKDWKSWGIANKQYGQGSLLQAWMMDVASSGNDVGMAKIMGSAPERMYLEMRHVQVKKSPNTALNSIQYSQDDALFNNLLGSNKGAFNPTIANIFSSLRSVSSMARLGGVVARSIPDIANIGGSSMRAGVGFWAPYFDAIVHAFDLIPSESRKIMARDMSHSIMVHSGTASRYVETAGMGNMVNKMSNKFFHGIGLNAWDKGNRLSAMTPIMKGYGRASSKSFDRLNGQQQSYLRRFNIGEHEWDALRSKTEKRFFTTDNKQ